MRTALLSVLISLFPLSQQLTTAGNNASRQPAAFHFTANMGDHLSTPQKQNDTTDIEQLKQSDWYSTAMKNLEESEYHFNVIGNNSYSTPNRKNNFRFFYDENGFTVEPRTTKIPIGDHDKTVRPDEIKYKELPDWKVAFQLDKKQIGKGTWQINNNKAEYKTDNITVQYINNEEGMRQNFIVQKPLSDAKELKLNFKVKTALKQQFSPDRVEFIHKKSGIVLNYEDLKVWDASGNILPAAFAKEGNDYSIRVNTDNATYPITIDPLSTSPATTIESNRANALMGYSVSSAGDVNGDGYSDVIIGAPSYNNEGAIFIYHGSATGISTTGAVTVQSGQLNAQMGVSVSGAGDVNGDGYSDVIVGVQLYDAGQSNEGMVIIYYGSATGINTATADTVQSNQANARMGYSVSGAGDVNGDGYSDVIAGAPFYSNGQTDEGATYVYRGSATGINTATVVILEKNQVNAQFGSSVACAGDVNGDGYSDLIIGSPYYDNGQTDEGVAFIHHGSASGINTTSAIMLESDQANANMGISVSGAGDVAADGYSDVIVGAHAYDNGEVNEGAAFVYRGSDTGITTLAPTILESNQADARMGMSVACAGDVNGDGYSDVIIGAFLYNNGQLDEGVAFIYQGSSLGIFGSTPTMVERNQASSRFGSSVSSAGDVNGDGYSDVMVGASFYDNGQTDEGASFIYHGSAAGLNTSAADMTESNQANAQMGTSVASAGDVNGDGYSDVIVGAPYYDNIRTDEGAAFIYHGSFLGLNTTAAIRLTKSWQGALMGISVASAGDVNGDGYSDVIIGAPLYTSGGMELGAFLVYYGSATGITTGPHAVKTATLAATRWGWSVSCAGDVNGDGYSDVIIGAPFFDTGFGVEVDEGAAYIYHGSASGLSSSYAVRIKRNQGGAHMGYSVSGAGDVNGDGYSDVIVGAPLYDNVQNDEGAAFVYHGSATGISNTVAATVESNQVQANLGWSVSSAGNVNGDGYSDVIVGAYSYDNGQINEGAAFIYHGRATGINTTAAATVESNQAALLFVPMGISVAGAGDVNGDGYSDVMVGYPLYDNGEADEGVVFIYHGSATGINTTAVAMLENNQANAQMGYSVSAAGDINGDGYSDVIVGASLYDNGQTDEGAAFVYNGNNASFPVPPRRNDLNLYNTDLSTPLSRSNYSRSNFGAGLHIQSFLGRTKGKLVWETRLNYNSYSGTPITNSVAYTSQQSGYTDLGLTGTELKNLVAKQPGAGGQYTKIRARVKYSLTTAITGQVYGPWKYVPEQIAAQSLGTTLPVDLISFKAAWQQEGKTATIDFTTDNESGICCYEIEKSSDGFNFNTIAQLQATNTTALYTYHSIDNNATGKKQYYRLKTIHSSGDIDYSNIQLLIYNNTSMEIIVFPNPTKDILQLQLNKAYAKMKVQIVSSTGQTVKQINNLAVTNQKIKIPVSSLASGIYFLYLQIGEEKQVLQFVKE